MITDKGRGRENSNNKHRKKIKFRGDANGASHTGRQETVMEKAGAPLVVLVREIFEDKEIKI